MFLTVFIHLFKIIQRDSSTEFKIKGGPDTLGGHARARSETTAFSSWYFCTNMLTFFLRGVGKKSLLIFWNSVFERVENIEKKGAKKN